MTKEELEEKGFVFESEEGGIFNQFVKKIDSSISLVLAITPVPELFVWISDTDADDKESDGIRVMLDTDDINLAIQCAHIISGVEF